MSFTINLVDELLDFLHPPPNPEASNTHSVMKERPQESTQPDETETKAVQPPSPSNQQSKKRKRKKKKKPSKSSGHQNNDNSNPKRSGYPKSFGSPKKRRGRNNKNDEEFCVKGRTHFFSAEEKRDWCFNKFMEIHAQLPVESQQKFHVPVVPPAPSSTETDTKRDDGQDVDKPPFADREIKSDNFFLFKKRPVKKKTFKGKTSEEKRDDNTTGSFAEVQAEYAATQQEVMEIHSQEEWCMYYYTRYLFFASEACRKEVANWKHFGKKGAIYMPEIPPEELDAFFAIKPPSDDIPPKYWYQRYRYFSQFDDGIQLDLQSWYSVTPEKIARDIASHCMSAFPADQDDITMIDAFCGCGGNAIQFACHPKCGKVIAIDVDGTKIEMAKKNAGIYGVTEKIEFICADFFEIGPTVSGDGVFLSPPWGGECYTDRTFNLRNMDGMDGVELFEFVRGNVSTNVAYFVPKNSDYRQLQALAGKKAFCQISKNKLFGKIKSITAYYGLFCQK